MSDMIIRGASLEGHASVEKVKPEVEFSEVMWFLSHLP